MKNIDTIVIKEQVFCVNQFEKSCFCRLKNVYNSYFSANNIAECIGLQHMQCLIFSIEGTGAVVHKNQTKTQLPPNTIFLGAMKDMHAIKSASPRWHFLCYWYFIENIDQDLCGTYPSTSFDTEKELADANEIIELMQSRSYLKTSIASAMFTTKLLTIASQIKANKNDKHTLFDEILSYVNTHIKEKLTTKQIAEEFGYCEKHIRYLFNKHLKTSPNRFIDELKLEQILALLQNSSYSIEEMAEIFSYSSASHLISNFKKKYSCSPKQYLKRLKIRLEYAKSQGDQL